MQISLDTAKKLNWLWKDEHEIEWIETFVKLADKSGKIIPFKLTPEQKELVNGLDHKNIIAKADNLVVRWSAAEFLLGDVCVILIQHVCLYRIRKRVQTKYLAN